MPLRLNTLSDNDAAESLARHESEIARWEERGVDLGVRRVPSAAPRYYEKLALLYFKAGALAYQQERPDEQVARYLALAGQRAVENLEHRSRPVISTNRHFYDLVERVLGCVIPFCDASWRARLAALPEWAFHWPHDPKWEFIAGSRERPRQQHGYYRLAYTRHAIEIAAKGSVDGPAMQALIQELDNDPGTQDDREEANLCLWMLMGIADRNVGFLEQTLGKLCALHEGRARRGQYQTMSEGLLFMNGLFLRQLAYEHGVTLNTRSDYLP